MDQTETQVLRTLAASTVPLDPTQLAEQADLLPADTDAALDRLRLRGLVKRFRSQDPKRRDTYQVVRTEARRRQGLPSMTVTYMQGFWGAHDHLESPSSQPAEVASRG